MPIWTNWGRTVRAEPTAYETPADLDELVEVVSRAAERRTRVKVVGAGHSFSDIAATDGVLVHIGRLDGILALEPTADGALVEVGAGTTLRALNRALWERGYAVENLGDIDAQSVAGAVSTGTHGTGAAFRGLAAGVRALRIVTPDGRIRTCSADHDGDLFQAARLGLGALGALATVTLACVPAFGLRAVERPEPLATTIEDLDRIRSTRDHFEFYWFPGTDRALTKSNTRIGAAAHVPLPRWRSLLDDEVLSNGALWTVNALALAAPRAIPTVNTVASHALSAREYSDRSYRVFASARRVRFREMEYAIPVESVADALRAIRRWFDSHAPVPFPLEVRFAAADDVWLSTAYGRESAYIAVHRYHRTPEDSYFTDIESILRDLDGRPHWGKMHTRTAADLRPAYPRFDEFVAVRDRIDPDRVFANAYLERVLGS